MKAHMASTLAIAMAATIGFVSPARSQVVDTTLWVTNGFVYAAARSGTTLFIGGDFTAVGPATAGGVPLTTTDGSPMAPFPKVAGAVLAIAPDGSGGWYIGGSFNAVGGLPRAGLAHVRADRTVAPWNPNVSGGANTYRVEAIALSGNTVYIGGDFSTMGGLQRKNLAALNGTTAAVTSWNPGTDSTVHALAVSGQVVYVGGEFDLISGQSRSRIAALDATTAAATAWDPNATSSGVDNYVAALVVSGNLVYAAGNYQGIGGQVRRSLAALDATTGLATAWNPGASVTYQVMSLAVSGSVVYASGNFATIGGQSRSNLAALDATTGLATAWNPGSDGMALSLAVSGGTVYAAGGFTTIGGQTRNHLAALDATTGTPTAWNPNANNAGEALCVTGTTVYVGGYFSSLGGQARSNVASIDVTTGQVTPWDPSAGNNLNLNTTNSVLAMAVSGATVYVGGMFTKIGGQARSYVAALDATTGLATDWNPNADYFVNAIEASGSTIYAGGGFFNIGSQVRHGLAALDATTGLATGWNPNADGANTIVRALAQRGNTIYAGGGFTSIGGQPRNYIAALDVSTGMATSWDPNADGAVYALAVGGSAVYVGGVFSAIGGQARSRIAALDTTSGVASAWNPDASSSGGSSAVLALAVGEGAVYAGGAFTRIGGQLRTGVAALDLGSGQATAWNPGVDGALYALEVSGSTIYLAGIFTDVAHQPQSGIAAMQDSYTPTLLARFEAEATSDGVQLRWSFGEPSRVVTATLERAGSRSGPWIPIALEHHQTANATEALDQSVVAGQSYYYRLTADLTDGTHATFGPISASALLVARVSGLTGISPNPASGSARIDFALAREEKVRVSVVDVAGREAAVLTDGAMTPGVYSVSWDGRVGSRRLSAGVYFVRWESSGRMMNRRLVLAR